MHAQNVSQVSETSHVQGRKSHTQHNYFTCVKQISHAFYEVHVHSKNFTCIKNTFHMNYKSFTCM